MARQLFVIGCRDALRTVRLGLFARYKAVMTDRIRIIKHEIVPDCGSFEVRFADGRESKFFYRMTWQGAGCGRRSDQRRGASASQGICAG